jgi:DNA-directed RNA polymerase sigma subunit (sigma70/sigma32)
LSEESDGDRLGGLVEGIARRYVTPTRSLDECVAVGKQGLQKAVDTFDEEKGFKLATVASWHIRQALHAAFGPLDESND